MARKFVAASSDAMTLPLVFNGSKKISISFWAFISSYSNSDFKVYWTSKDGSVGSHSGFDALPSRGSTFAGKSSIGMVRATNLFREDAFTRPSTGVWHHHLYTHDRSTSTNTVYIDGIAQTLTSISGNGQNDAFADATITFCKYSTTYLDTSIADWAIWNGVLLGQGEASALSRGRSPLEVRADLLLAYLPLDNPQREHVFGRMGQRIPNLTTLTGTTPVASPFGHRAIPRKREAVFA